MSLKEKALQIDIESYLRGEQPLQDAMAKAARIEDWAPVISRGLHGGYVMKLVGRVSNHPTVADGKVTETSEVCWLDRKSRWARTRSRLWLLGKPEGSEPAVDGLEL